MNLLFNRRRLLPLFFLIAGFSCSFAQFNFRGNVESGYYNSSNDFASSKGNMIIAAEGKAGYKFVQENSEALFELKVRPELFGLDKKYFSLKMRGNFNLLRREEKFDWGVDITRHFNRVNGDKININYDLFSIQGNSTFYFFENLPLSVFAGYAYQNINSSSRQNHDIIFFEGKVHGVFSPFFRVSCGAYAEKYLIEGESVINYSKKNETSEGLRFCPEVEINYLKGFVLNGQYRILFHSSKNSAIPANEHWIRLLAGKSIIPELSVFLLADFYIRRIKNVGDSQRTSIIYSPFNNENHVSIKLGYEISEKAEIYFKAGYFRHNFFYNDFLFEGWNVLMGIELSQ